MPSLPNTHTRRPASNYNQTQSRHRIQTVATIKTIRDLLHFYTATVRPVLEYAGPVWHLGLTAGQSNAVENIQKRAIRVIYSDTDGDYEIALIVAGTDSLKDRREMLMARFFKRQVLALVMPYSTTCCLNDVTMTLFAASEILNPFPQSEPAQISFTNLSYLTVRETLHS